MLRDGSRHGRNGGRCRHALRTRIDAPVGAPEAASHCAACMASGDPSLASRTRITDPPLSIFIRMYAEPRVSHGSSRLAPAVGRSPSDTRSSPIGPIAPRARRPRRLHRCPELSHPQSTHAPIKRFAVPAVPVTDEIPRRIPIRDTGVHDLLSVQSAVGCRVTRTCRICRVSWCMTKKTYSVLKNTVRTLKKSHAQMFLARSVKNFRQMGRAKRGLAGGPRP